MSFRRFRRRRRRCKGGADGARPLFPERGLPLRISIITGEKPCRCDDATPWQKGEVIAALGERRRELWH
ncbi:unnamed protein product [Strongylus vulgaris]|uniref:Uncharacterized protein n=1 Tax=Strongylus vulgaris TaxID=40348 RepID=A0A3P7JA74_STRVU|nr:unnamed protein product [Strongylus vulgaris]